MNKLPISGVKLVADNARGFQSDMDSSRKTLQKFEEAAARAARGGVSKFSLGTAALGALMGASSFLSSMDRGGQSVSRFGDSAREAGRDTEGFSMKAMAMASFIGNIASVAVARGVQALWQFGQQAVQNAASLQSLTISLESLIAKEYKMSGAVDTMAEAMERAIPAAQVLFKEIERISLVSPFEYQDVVQVFRLNVAFGIAAGTSLKLTQAILDMTAAGGHGGAMMQRIAYNFAQMARVGKITTRDVRDLSMAGVDLAEVMRESLGKSIEEVNAALQSGQMTFEDVSNAFVKYADENFAGAAERMSRTFQGVFSSFKDLIFFTSKALAGGALQEVTNLLGDILDNAMEIVKSGALDYVGASFEILAKKGVGLVRSMFNIKEATEQAGYATEGMAQVMERNAARAAEETRKRMEDTAVNAFSWGANIVTQIANGMISALSYVLQAIMQIGNLIAQWLMPGSPPAVAPGLTDWGEGAVRSWLEGFTKADFGVLKAMQSPLQSYLSNLVGMGQLTGEGMSSIMTSLSKKLTKALSTGAGIGGVMSKVSSLGTIGSEIADLIKMQYNLATATEAVEQAEKRLREAREDQYESAKEASDLTKEYNRLLREGADEATLEAKLAEIRAAEESGRLAKDRAEAAAEELKTTSEGVEEMQEKTALQQELVDQLLFMQRLQAKGMAGLGGGRGGAGDIAGAAGIPELSEMLKNIGADDAANPVMEAFKKRLEAEWDAMLLNIRTKWEESDIAGLWDGVQEAWGAAWDGIVARWQSSPLSGTLIGRLVSDILGIEEAQIVPATGGLQEVMDRRAAEAVTPWEEMKIKFGEIWDSMQAKWVEFQPTLLAIVAGFLTAWTVIRSVVTSAWEAIQPALSELIGRLGELGINWELVKNVIVAAGAIIAAILLFVIGIVTGVVNGLLTAANWAMETFQIIVIGLQMMWQGFVNILQGIVVLIIGIVGGFLGVIVGLITGNMDQVRMALSSAWAFIKEGFTMLFGGLIQLVLGALTAIVGQFVTAGAALLGVVWGFLKGIWDFFKGLADDLIYNSLIPDMLSSILTAFVDFISDSLKNIGQWITDLLALFVPSEWLEAGKAIIQGLWDGMVELWGKVWDWIQETFGAVLELLQELFKFGSPSKVMEDMGVNIMLGFAKGIEKMGSAPAEMLAAAADKMISAAASVPATLMEMLSEVGGEVSAGGRGDAVDAMIAQPVEVNGGESGASTNILELNQTIPVNNALDAEQVRLIVRDEISRAFRA